MANKPNTNKAGAEATDDLTAGKSKDEDSQGNTAASGLGPTQAVFEGDSTPGGADPAIDTTAVISDTSNDDANPKNDPSDDKVQRELDAIQRKLDDPSHVKEGDESPVVRDNGVDLFAASDTGPNRQGNAYGMSRDAIENFKRDLENERDRLDQRHKAIEKELDELEKQVEGSPAGDKIDTDNANANILREAKNEQENKSKGDNHPQTGEGDDNNPKDS